MDIYTFDSEEEREKFVKEFDKPVADNVEYDGKPAVFYSIVGHLARESAKEAGEYYGLRVDLDADYIIGKNWGDCH